MDVEAAVHARDQRQKRRRFSRLDLEYLNLPFAHKLEGGGGNNQKANEISGRSAQHLDHWRGYQKFLKPSTTMNRCEDAISYGNTH